jgi:hypothetical protein
VYSALSLLELELDVSFSAIIFSFVERYICEPDKTWVSTNCRHGLAKADDAAEEIDNADREENGAGKDEQQGAEEKKDGGIEGEEEAGNAQLHGK